MLFDINFVTANLIFKSFSREFYVIAVNESILKTKAERNILNIFISNIIFNTL